MTGERVALRYREAGRAWPYDMEELAGHLYHAGGLLAFYKDPGRDRPSPHHYPGARLASVGQIAGSGVGLASARCARNRAYSGPYKNRGAQGVQSPPGPLTGGSGLLERALAAACGFIREVLACGDPGRAVDRCPQFLASAPARGGGAGR